jgi:hypothetical protein
MAANITQRNSNKGNFALYIILFIVLLALNGVLNFIVANFIWSTILTASYWLKTIAGAGSGLGAFIIFAFMRRDALTLNDAIFNQEVDELNTIIREKVADDFTDYIAYENREMKKAKWRQKYENKRTK